jgi:hypothetical protein
MTKQEFEKRIKWEYEIGCVLIKVPLFDKDIMLELFSGDSKEPVISNKMFETANDVLNLPLESIDKIKDLLWEECNFSFAVTDYGFEPTEGETSMEASFREFELYNKGDTYEKCEIRTVQIHFENDELQARYAEIKIETATGNLISIIVKNGKVIDYDDDGTYLKWFETDEQHAHNKRKKVLDK